MRFSFFLVLLLIHVFGHAQLTDDFSDGDFSQNPGWSGESSLFQISGDFQLQSNGQGQNDVIHLSTTNSLLGETEWRFDVSYNFAPSSTNQMRIYLVSDQADLEGPLNGYFIQIGEGQSLDSYDLFRQDGSSTTKIIDGIDSAAASGVDASIKVLRDLSGNWTLEVDYDRNGVFVNQGSVPDLTHANTAFFGVWVKHTSGRAQAYFFDNFYIGAPIVDLEPPVAQTVRFLGPTELEVEFDEGVGSMSAEETSNYLLIPGNQFPTLAIQSASGSPIVQLIFGTALTEGQSYDLLISHIDDLSGNVMPETDTLSFLFDLPDTAGWKDVLINEIMPDPTPSAGLPEAEYIELYNRSSKSLELEGWTYSNGSAITTFPAFEFQAGTYVILVDQDNVSSFLSFGHVIGLEDMPTLVNTRDNLGIRSVEGKLIDSLDYERDWFQDETKDDGGYALELIWPEQFSCPPATNWAAATLNGTPGTQNSRYDPNPDTEAPAIREAQALTNTIIRLCFDKSMDVNTLMSPGAYDLSPGLGSPNGVEIEDDEDQCVILTFGASLVAGTVYTLSVDQVEDCSGNQLPSSEVDIAIGLPATPFDIVITELFPDASPPIALPEAEFIELHNRTDKVLDIQQFSLSDGSSTVSWGSQVMFPGEYLIVCKDDDADQFNPYGKVLALADLPSLNNNEDSLILLDRNQSIIDAVHYTDDWYRSNEKSQGGWTLERLDVDFVDCNHPNNWIASVSPNGGTPGQANSVRRAFIDSLAPGLHSWELLDPQTIRILFDEPMDLSSLELIEAYDLQPSIGNPESVAAFTGALSSAILSFSSPMDSSLIYQLSIDSLADCSQNFLRTQIPVGIATPPNPFDIIFSEIFPDFDPVIGMPEAEFFEFYVRGDRMIDMAGSQLTDGTSVIEFPTTALLPQTYYIVCSERDVEDFAGFGEVLAFSSTLPSQNNQADSLWLRNAEGELIDYLFYSSDWYRDDEKKQGGWTLERIDLDFVDCNHENNWIASNNNEGGTPGAMNSLDGSFSDSSTPRIIGIDIPSPSEIILSFDEQMNPMVLEDIQHFDLGQNIGQPVFSIVPSAYPRSVHLMFDSEMASRQVYELTINGLENCSQLLLDTTILLGVPEPAETADVLINEILFNPYTGASDFVEIVNVSDKVLDLFDLGIGEIDPETGEIFNTDQMSNGSRLLLPGELLCLSSNVAIQQEIYLPPSDANFYQMDGFPSYDDRAGICVLFRQSDSLRLDRFSYEDDFHFATLADDEGVSLERLSLLRSTEDPDNWHSAASTVGYATPGYENSQKLELENPSEEVSLSPQTFSPNQDGQDDVLSIEYLFDSPGGNARISILDSRGRLVKILHQNVLLSSGNGTFFWDGTDGRGGRAPIGTYIVLFEVVNTNTGSRELYRRVCVLADQLSSG